ncbi:MAG: hypothetical protein GY770_29305 [Aestuariibacter sp.]|nr:hypothetical protein [Aestuariibacter sp.]
MGMNRISTGLTGVKTPTVAEHLFGARLGQIAGYTSSALGLATNAPKALDSVVDAVEFASDIEGIANDN